MSEDGRRFKMNKKGVEITMNAMIIALLVLIAFAVIIAIFLGGTKTLGEWFKGTSSCTAQGGQCVPAASDCDGQAIPRKDCSNKGAGDEFCCLKRNT